MIFSTCLNSLGAVGDSMFRPARMRKTWAYNEGLSEHASRSLQEKGVKRNQYTVRALFVSSVSVGVRRVLTSVGTQYQRATGTPRTYPSE